VRPGRAERWLDQAGNAGIVGCLLAATFPAIGLVGYAAWAAVHALWGLW